MQSMDEMHQFSWSCLCQLVLYSFLHLNTIQYETDDFTHCATLTSFTTTRHEFNTFISPTSLLLYTTMKMRKRSYTMYDYRPIMYSHLNKVSNCIHFCSTFEIQKMLRVHIPSYHMKILVWNNNPEIQINSNHGLTGIKYAIDIRHNTWIYQNIWLYEIHKISNIRCPCPASLYTRKKQWVMNTQWHLLCNCHKDKWYSTWISLRIEWRQKQVI